MCNVFVAQAAWPVAGSPSLLPEVESLAQEVFAREKERTRTEHPTPKKTKTARASFGENDRVQFRPGAERSGDRWPMRQRGSRLSWSQRNAGGIQFQPFHFCAHCEGQTLTGTISLPSPHSLSLRLCADSAAFLH